ncbi:MAG: hypothetical protein QG621_92 [Patescibacteria group bacterium]|nr:hypothetical protein [Patescibacteria group bacterium]
MSERLITREASLGELVVVQFSDRSYALIRHDGERARVRRGFSISDQAGIVAFEFAVNQDIGLRPNVLADAVGVRPADSLCIVIAELTDVVEMLGLNRYDYFVAEGGRYRLHRSRVGAL